MKTQRQRYRLFHRALQIADNPYRKVQFDPLTEFIPSEGFLGGYMAYTEECEAPARFRLMAGMGLLSSCLLRNIWIPWGSNNCYPNLWLLLIGPPGSGKDTAIDQAADIFYRLPDRPLVLSEKTSPEALVYMLAYNFKNGKPDGPRDATGVVYSNELGIFFGKQKYMEGLIPILARFFDCPSYWSYSTMAHGVIPVKNMCLTMNWGCIPDWLAEEMPREVFTGGLLSRIIFVVYLGEEKSVFMPPQPSEGIKRFLVKYLASVIQLSGPMKFTPDAYHLFEKWYNSRKFSDESIPGYFKRRHHHILKLSMLLSVSDSLERLITVDHVRRAMGIMGALELTMGSSMAEAQLAPEVKRPMKVVGYLNREPFLTEGCERRRVLAATHRHFPGGVDEFNKAIQLLTESGQIETFYHEKKVMYRVAERDEELLMREEDVVQPS